jgi:murein DD-endopeptidase MepM/ murein hydrolase activator NlpD
VVATPPHDSTRPPALIVPVEGVPADRVPDTFNAPRGGRAHRAIDILAPRGTPVLAATDMTVYRIRNSEGGGLSVYAIDASERWMFYYAHLDRFRGGLAEGTKLAQGETIGYVGTTGNAPPDTPHLHFQLMRARFDARWWDGEALDPRPYFVRVGDTR